MENWLRKEGLVGLSPDWPGTEAWGAGGQSHGIREAWQQVFGHLREDWEAESKLEARPGYNSKACSPPQ